MYKMHKNFDDGVLQFEIEIPEFVVDDDAAELLYDLSGIIPDYGFHIRKERPAPKDVPSTIKTMPNPHNEWTKALEWCVKESAKKAAEPVAPVKPTAVPALPEIERVAFYAPSTVVFWKDGSKTVVKCDDDYFDQEKGLAMAYIKKLMGNTGAYYEMFRKYCTETNPVPIKEAIKANKKEAKKV